MNTCMYINIGTNRIKWVNMFHCACMHIIVQKTHGLKVLRKSLNCLSFILLVKVCSCQHIVDCLLYAHRLCIIGLWELSGTCQDWNQTVSVLRCCCPPPAGQTAARYWPAFIFYAPLGVKGTLCLWPQRSPAAVQACSTWFRHWFSRLERFFKSVWFIRKRISATNRKKYYRKEIFILRCYDEISWIRWM